MTDSPQVAGVNLGAVLDLGWGPPRWEDEKYVVKTMPVKPSL